MYMNGQQSLVLREVEFAGAGSYNGTGSGGPASSRVNYIPTSNLNFVGFRPVLYIKL